MIIVAIIALSAVVLVAIYATFVGLPSLPEVVITFTTYFIGIIGDGAGFLKGILQASSVINGLVNITLAYEVVKMSYKFVMWVAKKIPMFGVTD